MNEKDLKKIRLTDEKVLDFLSKRVDSNTLKRIENALKKKSSSIAKKDAANGILTVKCECGNEEIIELTGYELIAGMASRTCDNCGKGILVKRN